MDRIKLTNYKEHFCKGLFFTSPIYSFLGLKTYENMIHYFSLDDTLLNEPILKTESQLSFSNNIFSKFKDTFLAASTPSSSEVNRPLHNTMEIPSSNNLNILMIRLRQIESFNKSKINVVIIERAKNGFVHDAQFLLNFSEEKLFEKILTMIQTNIKTSDILAFESNGFFNPNFIRRIIENSCNLFLHCFSCENNMGKQEYDLVQMQTNSKMFVLCNPFSCQSGSFIFTNIKNESALRISLEQIMRRPFFLDFWRIDPNIFGEHSWSVDILVFFLETCCKNTFLIYYESKQEKHNQEQFSKFRDLIAQKLLPKEDQRKLLGEETIRFAFSESFPSDAKGENQFLKDELNKNKFGSGNKESEGGENVTHFLMKIDKWCKKCKVCQKKGKKSKSKYACKACTEELGRDITLCVDGCFAEFHQNRPKFLKRKPRQEFRTKKKC